MDLLCRPTRCVDCVEEIVSPAMQNGDNREELMNSLFFDESSPFDDAVEIGPFAKAKCSPKVGQKELISALTELSEEAFLMDAIFANTSPSGLNDRICKVPSPVQQPQQILIEKSEDDAFLLDESHGYGNNDNREAQGLNGKKDRAPAKRQEDYRSGRSTGSEKLEDPRSERGGLAFREQRQEDWRRRPGSAFARPKAFSEDDNGLRTRKRVLDDTSITKSVQRAHHNACGKDTGLLGKRGTSAEPAYPTLLSSLNHERDKQRQRYWQGTYLDCMIAVGDVVAMSHGNQMSQVGAAGGMFGHVLLVTAMPLCIKKHTPEGSEFLGIWPPDKVQEIFQVPVIECTRSTEGIHETSALLYVDAHSHRIILLGNVEENGIIFAYESHEREAVELWKSPPELRDCSCRDLKEAVVRDMKENQANWSWYTAMRAFLLPAGMENQHLLSPAQITSDRQELLKEVEECWRSAPICSSLPIIFWQRYLCKLSQSGRAPEGTLAKMSAIDMIVAYMPLKSDRTLPGELLRFLHKSGWTLIQQVHAAQRTRASSVEPRRQSGF